MRLGSTSDTEVIAALIAQHPGTLAEGACATRWSASAAPSPRSSLSEDTLLAFRDPDGIRPLVLGDLDGASGRGLGDAARSTSSARPWCASSSRASW